MTTIGWVNKRRCRPVRVGAPSELSRSAIAAKRLSNARNARRPRKRPASGPRQRTTAGDAAVRGVYRDANGTWVAVVYQLGRDGRVDVWGDRYWYRTRAQARAGRWSDQVGDGSGGVE